MLVASAIVGAAEAETAPNGVDERPVERPSQLTVPLSPSAFETLPTPKELSDAISRALAEATGQESDSPSEAAPEPETVSHERNAPQDPRKAPRILLPAATTPAFDLAQHDMHRFIEDRSILLGMLAAERSGDSEDDGPSVHEAEILLDLAALHLAHGLLPEGRSVLGGLSDDLQLPQALRRDVLRIGFWALSGAAPDAATQTMIETSGVFWPERPLLLALTNARAGATSEAAPHLEAALARLDTLPPPVAATLLPELLEVAIDAEDWPVAKSFATRFAYHPDLLEGAAYRYLLGRAAEAGKDHLAAFESYSVASAGSDRWAQRARLALIAMGRSTGSLGDEDARTLLLQSASIWRGDDLEIEALERLAEVSLELDDEVTAIGAFGEIIRRHPETPAADHAAAETAVLIDDLYDRGASGEMRLSAFLNAHRAIAPDFAFQPGFAAQSERLADRMFEIGATAGAAEEYAATHDRLAVLRDLEIEEVAPERFDVLRLKKAEALIRGGQFVLAAPLLAAPMEGSSEKLEDRANLLRAEMFSETGENSAVLATRMTAPPASYRRIRALAHYAEADWPAARDEYARLWRAEGRALPFGDAINLLLSAHRAGDSVLVLELARAFPDLTESPQWREIAEGLTQSAPEIFPLKAQSAQQRMDEAGETVSRLEAIAGGG